MVHCSNSQAMKNDCSARWKSFFDFSFCWVATKNFGKAERKKSSIILIILFLIKVLQKQTCSIIKNRFCFSHLGNASAIFQGRSLKIWWFYFIEFFILLKLLFQSSRFWRLLEKNLLTIRSKDECEGNHVFRL